MPGIEFRLALMFDLGGLVEGNCLLPNLRRPRRSASDVCTFGASAAPSSRKHRIGANGVCHRIFIWPPSSLRGKGAMKDKPITLNKFSVY